MKRAIILMLAGLASFVIFASLGSLAYDDSIVLYPGYVTKLRCEGRLILTAVGSDSLVALDALPRELGCGVLVKPIAGPGRTNIILETTAGTIRRQVEITNDGPSKKNPSLEYLLRGGVE